MANPANSSGGSDPAADAAAKANNALWYTFYNDGRAYLIKSGTIASTEARTNGFHGYPTIEQAQANPNTTNSGSGSTVSGWAQAASAPVGGGSFGVIETINITAPSNGKPAQYSTPQNPDTAAAKNATGISSVTDFLQGLTSANLWIRVAKVAIGGTLLIVGLAKLTGAEEKMGGVVKGAVKAAPFL